MTENKLPGFTAMNSLTRPSKNYVEKAQQRGVNMPSVTPQGCCVSGPFGICLVSSPLCP
jgi:hypothetical protein